MICTFISIIFRIIASAAKNYRKGNAIQNSPAVKKVCSAEEGYCVKKM